MCSRRWSGYGGYRIVGYDHDYEKFKTEIADEVAEYDMMVGTKNRPGFIGNTSPQYYGIDNIKVNYDQASGGLRILERGALNHYALF